MANFEWDAVIRPLVDEQGVVPVVGAGLLDVSLDGTTAPFLERVARAAATAQHLPNAEQVRSLGDLVLARGVAQSRMPPFSTAVFKAHKQLADRVEQLDALPEGLRLLAEITDFRLFLSTTPDDLLARALRKAGRSSATAASPLSPIADLGPAWQPPPPSTPLLVQILGQFKAVPGSAALSDEDVLEVVQNIASDRAPANLLHELRRRHLLFIGTRFPDWPTRIFMRALRGKRFSECDGNCIQTLADEKAPSEGGLVCFLADFSPTTMIFEEGDATAFVRELHRRWREERPVQPTGASAVAAATGLDAMVPGAIFVSYCSRDHAAAVRFCDGLQAQGLDVWLDRRRLVAGDVYDDVIRDNIRKCELFVPLLSQQTEGPKERFFVGEHQDALERNRTVKGFTFIAPVAIDDIPAEQIDTHWRSMHVARAPGGEVDAMLALQFRDLLRTARTARRA
jgi:hypothetical protein